MKFSFAHDGLSDLNKLEKGMRARILKKLKYWQDSKNPLFYAMHIEGASKLFRYRVGNWRIIVKRSNDTLDILRIGHRSEIYNEL